MFHTSRLAGLAAVVCAWAVCSNTPAQDPGGELPPAEREYRAPDGTWSLRCPDGWFLLGQGMGADVRDSVRSASGEWSPAFADAVDQDVAALAARMDAGHGVMALYADGGDVPDEDCPAWISVVRTAGGIPESAMRDPKFAAAAWESLCRGTPEDAGITQELVDSGVTTVDGHAAFHLSAHIGYGSQVPAQRMELWVVPIGNDKLALRAFVQEDRYEELMPAVHEFVRGLDGAVPTPERRPFAMLPYFVIGLVVLIVVTKAQERRRARKEAGLTAPPA